MPKLDAFFKKWLSRKLIVFIVGTAALYLNFLTGSEWLQLASVYIAGQSVVDTVSAYKAENNV